MALEGARRMSRGRQAALCWPIAANQQRPNRARKRADSSQGRTSGRDLHKQRSYYTSCAAVGLMAAARGSTLAVGLARAGGDGNGATAKRPPLVRKIGTDGLRFARRTAAPPTSLPGHREAWQAPAKPPGAIPAAHMWMPLLAARTFMAHQTGSRPGQPVRAASPAGGAQPVEKSSDEDPVEDDKGVFHNITKALRDFGFGRSTLWEGGVGLFMLSGLGLLFLLYSWIRGSMIGSSYKGYQAVMEFPQACGITVGTPVRIRGVPVGSVMNVRPSLERVDVLVEVRDQHTVIPRNSTIEANQSGLIAEPLIDITPELPIPDYKALPLDPECEKEGNILCNQGRIAGIPGVALDDLVYICTKLAKEMDSQGVDTMFDAAKSATVLMEEARPLLKKAVELAAEVIPLLKEVREGEMVGNLESLTSTASTAAEDIHRLQNEVLTRDNVDALRQSVTTLTKTLEHIENISGNVGSVTADGSVQRNMKQLIEALSRMIAD